MSLLKQLVATGGVSTPPTYVDDVFSAVPFSSTGTGTVLNVNTGFNFNYNYDPFFSNVKLLASFNTDNLNKADNSLIATTMSQVAGGLFGFCLQANRSSVGGSNQQYQPVTINNSDWNNPWCFEGRVNTGTVDSSNSNTIQSHIINTTGYSGASFVRLFQYADGTGGAFIHFEINDPINGNKNTTYTTSEYSWNFVRVSWDGSFIKLFVNGTQQYSVAWAGFTTLPLTGTPYFQCSVSNGVAATGTAKLDEVRWTFGNARTDTNNIVPTAPFPNSGTQGVAGVTIIHGRNVTGFDNIILENTTSVASPTAWNQTTPASSQSSSGISGFTSTGFVVGGSNIGYNSGSYTGFAWSFKKTTKFFDIVEYTGNGSVQTIAHDLNCAVGMIKIKRMDATGDAHYIWHNSLSGTQYLVSHNSSSATTDSNVYSSAPTSTNFSVGTNLSANGVKYVAMIWAHDTAATSNIKCGSFTAGSSDVFVNLGFEPQTILIKCTSTTGDWNLFDTARKLTVNADETVLKLNATGSETTFGALKIASNGFYATSAFGIGATFAYMAICKSNKPPTSGTQVFNAVARTGTGATATITGAGFPPDLVIPQIRNGSVWGANWFDRMRGANNYLQSAATIAENGNGVTTDTLMSFDSDGVSIGADTAGYMNTNTKTFVNWLFRRASGVFDTVCYTGNGAASQTITHGLGVAPELLITKNRSAASSWWTYNSPRGKNFYMALESPSAEVSSANIWGTTAPSATSFDVNSALSLTTNANNYITHLFATKAGVSKVGSYIGNGSSQNIDCGFASGARFIMIKCTSTTGDWLVADSARGIVAGNDPYLKLNSSASEVATEDWIDPLASGFIVNQVASSNANVNGANYIYLAFS